TEDQARHNRSRRRAHAIDPFVLPILLLQALGQFPVLPSGTRDDLAKCIVEFSENPCSLRCRIGISPNRRRQTSNF
ncbi:MAG: hypothetical protein QF435_16610, partial [Arenicellales bacterium]|nr:hypothetical protein [Arenicellales bacterium]